LGDVNCTIDLDSTDGWTNDHAVTAVASRHAFTCGSASEADDFYGDGIALALDGLNAGYRRKVKTFAASVFTLGMEMPFTVMIGDTFRFTAGCRKRWLEDCKTKFDNLLNFGGEKDIPGNDLITADPDIGG
jgi:uncharacterized phage protein (TIGR02218 family)